MAGTRVTQQLPPQLDPANARVAYGRDGIPKLNAELQPGTDLLVTRQALASLCTELRRPAAISQALTAGVPSSLQPLLAHSETDVRQLAAEAFLHISGHAVGRSAILSLGVIKPSLTTMLDDQAVHIRLLAHRVIERVTSQAEGAAAVIAQELVPTLVSKAGSEAIAEAGITVVALDTLHHCIRYDAAPALAIGTMETLVSLLAHADDSVRAGACRAIMDLSFPLEGKDQAVDRGAVPAVTALLEDPIGSLRAAAAGALMSIAVTTQGKYAAIDAGAPVLLASVLDSDGDERVLLACTKAINALAEAPAARQALQGCVSRLTVLLEFRGDRLDDMAVARNAQRAIDTITWKP